MIEFTEVPYIQYKEIPLEIIIKHTLIYYGINMYICIVCISVMRYICIHKIINND